MTFFSGDRGILEFHTGKNSCMCEPLSPSFVEVVLIPKDAKNTQNKSQKTPPPWLFLS